MEKLKPMYTAVEMVKWFLLYATVFYSGKQWNFQNNCLNIKI